MNNNWVVKFQLPGEIGVTNNNLTFTHPIKMYDINSIAFTCHSNLCNGLQIFNFLTLIPSI